MRLIKQDERMLIRKKKETRESDNKRDSGVKMLFMRSG